jgi:hypothetical protein
VGNQLAEAIRAVATGGTALDPVVVEALVRPVVSPGGLLPAEEELLGMIAEGKPIKAIAGDRMMANSYPAAIQARGLSKRYRKVTALSEATIAVPEG